MTFDEWFTQRRTHTTFFKAGLCEPIAKDAWDAALTAANERIRELEAENKFAWDTCTNAQNTYTAEREVSDKLEKALKVLVEAHGYASYVSNDEKESDPDVIAARAVLAEVAAIRANQGAS